MASILDQYSEELLGSKTLTGEEGRKAILEAEVKEYKPTKETYSGPTVKVKNFKTNQIVELPEDDAGHYLVLESEKYGPVRNEKYIVVDKETDEAEVVLGENLYQSLGEGKTLTNFDRYMTRKQLQAEHSQFGEGAKAALWEAVTLGVKDAMKSDPDSPLEKMQDEVYQELFGTARGVGKGVGVIAPFAAGYGALRLGVKGGLKLLKPLLKTIGKAPSAKVLKEVIKVSDKGGKLAAKGAAKLGAGKRVQKAAEVGGKALTFAAAEGAVRGSVTTVGETVKEVRSPLKESMPESANSAFSRVIGKGAKEAGETFKSTAIWMSVLGGAGKAIDLTGKAIGLGKKSTEFITRFGAKKARETALGTDRGAFFNNRLAMKNRDDIRRAFRLPKNTKDEDTLREASRFLEKRYGKERIYTKNKAIDTLKNDLKVLGKKIGDERKSISKLGRKYDIDIERRLFTKDHIKNELEKLKRIATPSERQTNLRSFVNDIERLKIGVKGRPGYNKVREIAEVLKDKSNFDKAGTTSTTAREAWKKAYSRWTKYDNRISKEIGKQAPETSKNLKALKADFEKIKTIEKIMDSQIQRGAHVGGFYVMRDLLPAVLGYQLAGGAAGTILAGSIYGGTVALRQTGYRLLNVANRLDKVNQIMVKAKTPRGVHQLIKEKTGIEAPIRLGSLGHFFFGKETKTIESFDEALETYDELEQVNTGQEDMYTAAQEYGGSEVSNEVNNTLIDMKQHILNTKPKPFVDPDSGETYYSENEKEMWLNDVNNSTSVQGFLNAVRNKSLTRDQYDAFSRFYPDFLMDFNLSLTQGLKNKSIEKTDVIESYMSLMHDSTENDMVFFNLDQMSKMKEDERRGGGRRQFNSRGRSSPTQSAVASSGGFQ